LHTVRTHLLKLEVHIIFHVQMRTTCPHVYGAMHVQTRLMIHPDVDPTASIKHGRRIFSPYPTNLSVGF